MAPSRRGDGGAQTARLLTPGKQATSCCWTRPSTFPVTDRRRHLLTRHRQRETVWWRPGVKQGEAVLSEFVQRKAHWQRPARSSHSGGDD